MTSPRTDSPRIRAALAALGFILAGVGSTAMAQAPASLPAQAASQKTASGAAEPKLKLSLTERVRQESSDNITTLNDQAAEGSAYVRFRTSLGLQWKPSRSFDFNVRLTNENRYYLNPKRDPKAGRNYEPHEIFFDALNARWSEAFGLPLTLTVGRQDIQMGEGFVIWDGGPLDGSRSAYFNALRLDWALGAKSALSLFYLNQPMTDEFLPRIHDRNQILVEQKEQAVGGYFSGPLREAAVEAYLLYKWAPAAANTPETSYALFGGRAAVPIVARLSLTAEAAGQSGELGSLPRRGFGGHFHLDYKTGAAFPLPSGLTLGGLYLSGDDPATGDAYEGWDPVFGRWPKWSESMIYLLGKETGKAAFWSNYASLFAGLQFALADNVRLAATLHRLSAPQETAPSGLWSGAGRSRGLLLGVKLQYDISRHLSGHFVWDHFRPGDFYRAGAQEYAWVRFELLFRY